MVTLNIDVSKDVYVGTWPDDLGGPGKATLNRLHDAFRKAKELAELFTVEAAKVTANETLSLIGKGEELGKLRDQHIGKVREFYPIVVKGEAHADKLRDGLDAGLRRVPTDPAEAVRAMEIRQWYRSADGSGQRDVVNEAIDGRDVETMRALISAPKAMRMLDETSATRVRGALIELTAGDDAALYQEHADGAMLAREALGMAESHIRRHVGELANVAAGIGVLGEGDPSDRFMSM